MKQSAAPAAVLIGSVAGQVSVGTGAPYAITKAALDQMARVLAAEWGPNGIRVNVVSPWFTETPLTEPLLADPTRRAQIVSRAPLGRVAQPEDIADAVAFLCLPAAAYISGQVVSVDGGFLAKGK